MVQLKMLQKGRGKYFLAILQLCGYFNYRYYTVLKYNSKLKYNNLKDTKR